MKHNGRGGQGTGDAASAPTPCVAARGVSQLSRVNGTGDLRKAHAQEELTTVITTRRLLALCARLARGNDFPRALDACVLNKVPPEDRNVISETFDHHVGPMGKKAAGA